MTSRSEVNGHSAVKRGSRDLRLLIQYVMTKMQKYHSPEGPVLGLCLWNHAIRIAAFLHGTEWRLRLRGDRQVLRKGLGFANS